MSPVTGGEGAIFGKLVHRLFEKLDWSQRDLLEKMAGIEGKAFGATGPMIKKAGEMVREAINSPIASSASLNQATTRKKFHLPIKITELFLKE